MIASVAYRSDKPGARTAQSSPVWSARATLVLGLMLTLHVFPARATADDVVDDLLGKSIEELLNLEVPTVYSASKREQSITNAPASVTIITADEIAKFGYRNLADVLGSIRGVHVIYDRNYHHIGLQGFNRPGDYDSRILKLIDGQRVNENVYGSGQSGTDSLIDLDIIERIEFVRGPGSALYGTSAFFGTINIITRNAESIDGVEASVGYGSDDSYHTRLAYGNTFDNGISAVVSGSFFDDPGAKRLFYEEFDDPSTNNGVAVKADGDRAGRFFSNFSYGDFNLQAAFSQRRKVVPTAAFFTIFNTRDTWTQEEQALLSLSYSKDVLTDAVVNGRAYFSHYAYKGEYLYDYRLLPSDPPDIVSNQDFATGQVIGGEMHGTKTIFDRHYVTVGGEFRSNFRQDQVNYEGDPKFYYLNAKKSTVEGGLYFQGEAALHENVMFTGGLRYDHFEAFGGTWNPRVALVISPVETSTLKLVYGRAYRAPSAYELYYEYDDGFTSVLRNPDLSEETVSTYEIIAEHFFTDRLYGTVSSYYYEVKDLISFVDIGGSISQFQNRGKTTAIGMSTELSYSTPNGFLARGSYAYQRAKDDATGTRLTNSPLHLAKFNLSVPFFDQLFNVGFEAQYTASMTAALGNHVDDFWVTNLTVLSNKLYRNLELSVSIYNLADTSYGHPGSLDHVQGVLPQDGRTFRLKASYRF